MECSQETPKFWGREDIAGLTAYRVIPPAGTTPERLTAFLCWFMGEIHSIHFPCVVWMSSEEHETHPFKEFFS